MTGRERKREEKRVREIEIEGVTKIDRDRRSDKERR